VEYFEIMRLLPILFSGLLIAACSGATTTIGGDDTTLDDGGDDSGSSSSGGSGDATTSGDTGSGGFDASASDGGIGDDGSTAGQLAVTINVTQLVQNCQPPVSQDPVQMTGTISVKNNMATSVGPITITDGAFYDAKNAKLATFKVNAVTIPLVAPGAGGSANITKATASMVPSNRCNTLPCTGTYIVEVTLNAPQLGSYQARTQPPVAILCTQQ
jgi:hypothetical protein